jgi:DNA segregation ATPase FtsK/SpoIIIE, S-DNA-T family
MAKKTTKNTSEQDSDTLSKPKFKLLTPQNRVLFGVLLVLFSVALFFAFISFLLYWREDQSAVYALAERSAHAYNWLGKFGAYLAHIFIFQSFGVASFIFVKLFFVTGLHLILKFGNKKQFTHMWFWDVFAIVVLSVFFGFAFDYVPELGGVVGFEMNDLLQDYLGSIGTILLLFFAFTIYLIFRVGVSPERIQKWLEPKPKPEPDTQIQHAVVNTNEFQDNQPKVRLSEEMTASVTETPQLRKQEEVLDENKPKSSFEVAKDQLKPTIKSASAIEWNTPKAEVSKSTETTLELTLENDKNQLYEDDEDIDFAGVDDDFDEDFDEDFDDEEEFIVHTAKEETLTDENLAAKLVANFGEFDPTLELKNYRFPSIDLLREHNTGGITINQEELEENKNKIVDTLRNYKIDIAQIKATVGPSVTLYEIVPEAGIRISKIKSLEDDIALSLSALGIRIIAPIPGKGTIGIEVPNKKPTMVSMRTVIASTKFQEAEMELPIALGKTISNETFVVDLAKMPHMLMAGATGQGKSVGLNAVLTSLLYKKHPAEVKFVLVDPKKVELTLFNKIERHYLAKLPDSEDAIITDNTKVILTLNSLCVEMDNRYMLLKDASVRNIKEYNDKFKHRKLNPENGHRFLPYIVLVVDEFADLIMTAGKEVETPIARLAQLARAIGIHLIIATQRPSVNVITGIIKANFPARIAFRVTSKIDSRTILDTQGADQLIGRGDLLYTNGNDVVRVQCAFVDTPEVEAITEFIGNQRAYPSAYLLPEVIGEESGTNLDIDISERDVMFREAAEVIVTAQQGSASLLQRKLKLGYNRAGRLIDQLEAAGIVGPFEGSKARGVNIPDLASLEEFFRSEEGRG